MAITKIQILDEIKRTAESNDGQPLGRQRFYAETGIKETDWSDWSGKYWARWSDALQEAGYSPNKFQLSYDDQLLLEKLATFIQELGHFPTIAELKLKRRQHPEFPSHGTFARLGSRTKLASRLVTFCQQHGGYEDVAIICESITINDESDTEHSATGRSETLGFVYLLKAGRYYKIGHSNAVGRRERELALQLPEQATVVHSIRTDDPLGIERYWHTRFKEHRKNGEWFELSTGEIHAFKRRKFM